MEAPRLNLVNRWITRHRMLARGILLVFVGLGLLDAVQSALSHEIAWWHALLRVLGAVVIAWCLGWYMPRLVDRADQNLDESSSQRP